MNLSKRNWVMFRTRSTSSYYRKRKKWRRESGKENQFILIITSSRARSELLFTFTKWELYKRMDAKYYMCKSWKKFLHCLGIIITSLYIFTWYYSTYRYLKLAIRVAGFYYPVIIFKTCLFNFEYLHGYVIFLVILSSKWQVQLLIHKYNAFTIIKNVLQLKFNRFRNLDKEF